MCTLFYDSTIDDLRFGGGGRFVTTQTDGLMTNSY